MNIRARVGYSLKSLAASVLYRTGLLQLWVRRTFRGQPVVLMYHRVLPPQAVAETWSHPRILVTRETFERHMRVVNRLFRVISLAEFIEHREGSRSFEKPACLITFDDGWRDTYTEAWPVLRRYGFPALVFLPVDFIGTGRMFWQERVSRDLHDIWVRARHDREFAVRAGLFLQRHELEGVLAAPAHRVREVIANAVRGRKQQAPASIRELIDGLASLTGGGAAEPSPVDAFIDWKQVDEMAAAGVTFGGHGTEHLILTNVSEDEAERDIRTSREVLQRQLRDGAASFSYPNGDWNPRVAAAVSRAGFRLAFTTAKPPTDDTWALPRVSVHQDAADSGPMLLARMVGLF